MTSSTTRLSRLNTCICWYFAGLGATASVVPAILPGIAAELAVPVQSVLAAVPVLFLGSFVGVVGAPVLAGRAALLSVLSWGAAGQAVGLTLAGLATNPTWFIAAAGIAGAGFGVVESAATAAIRLINDAGTPRRLTLLTVIVGAVATITPVAVLLLGGFELARLALPAAAAVQVVAVITSRGAVLPSRSHTLSPAKSPSPPALDTQRAVVTLGAALFFFVGAESILSGWSAATIAATLGTDPTTAALGTSGFWLLITFGRLLGTVLNNYLTASTAALVCCLIAAAALALGAVLETSNTACSLALIGIGILACGPCYALILGIAVTATSHHAAVRTSSAVVAAGAAGGAAVPLLTLTAFAGQSPTLAAAISMATAFLLLALGPRARRPFTRRGDHRRPCPETDGSGRYPPCR